MTSLYWASQAGWEDNVKAVLTYSGVRETLLNKAEKLTGWTPLFIACIEGHLGVVQILLGAGSEYGRYDLAGWTELEHAVFNGHMKVAKFLARFEAGVPPSGQSLRPMLSPEVLKTKSEDHNKLAHSLQPPGGRPNHFEIGSRQAQILVGLGPSNIRSHLNAVDLNLQDSDPVRSSREEPNYIVTIQAVGGMSDISHTVHLPEKGNMINSPFIFATDDPENTNLVFNISGPKSSEDQTEIEIGTGIALLTSLQRTLAAKQDSLIRDHTIPILAAGTMRFVGSLTFNLLVITPFRAVVSPLKPSPGFWKQDGSTQIVGHRGFGANSTARTNLQIGENTIQSFQSAYDLGASCVEFDVQLTKDYVPVIFHDFLVMEMGADVPLQILTADQFMHLSRSQAPRSSIVDAAELRYQDRTGIEMLSRRRPRSHSANAYDDYRSQDLKLRMAYTREGIHNKIKGNLRGHSIQEPSSTLEQLMIDLPESLAFNLEIKYPMLWEAEDRGMEFYAMELNFFVDTILDKIFRLCGNRNITLSSFSPEICITLALKQQHFPILFINKAGSAPAGDIRAGSLRGAMEFAKAWNLAGIVMLSDVFVMCPRLLGYAKNSGLVVGSYGNMNDDPDCAMIQAEAGLDAIMTNKVRLICETLARPRS